MQLLQPFQRGTERLYDMPILMRQGQCTTDHISAAGNWLTYRGHSKHQRQPVLGVVARSMYRRRGVDFRDGTPDTLPNLAKKYGEAGVRWVAIATQLRRGLITRARSDGAALSWCVVILARSSPAFTRPT